MAALRHSVGGRPSRVQVTGRWHIWEPLPIGRDRSKIIGARPTDHRSPTITFRSFGRAPTYTETTESLRASRGFLRKAYSPLRGPMCPLETPRSLQVTTPVVPISTGISPGALADNLVKEKWATSGVSPEAHGPWTLLQAEPTSIFCQFF